MIHAYDEQYLSDAMNNLGEMIDYAVNTCQYEINEFFQMFLVSGLAVQFAKGTPKVVSMTDIRKMYPTLHEASELKFADTVNSIARRKKRPTKRERNDRIVLLNG